MTADSPDESRPVLFNLFKAIFDRIGGAQIKWWPGGINGRASTVVATCAASLMGSDRSTLSTLHAGASHFVSSRTTFSARVRQLAVQEQLGPDEYQSRCAFPAKPVPDRPCSLHRRAIRPQSRMVVPMHGDDG